MKKLNTNVLLFLLAISMMLSVIPFGLTAFASSEMSSSASDEGSKNLSSVPAHPSMLDYVGEQPLSPGPEGDTYEEPLCDTPKVFLAPDGLTKIVQLSPQAISKIKNAKTAQNETDIANKLYEAVGIPKDALLGYSKNDFEEVMDYESISYAVSYFVITNDDEIEQVSESKYNATLVSEQPTITEGDIVTRAHTKFVTGKYTLYAGISTIPSDNRNIHELTVQYTGSTVSGAFDSNSFRIALGNYESTFFGVFQAYTYYVGNSGIHYGINYLSGSQVGSGATASFPYKIIEPGTLYVHLSTYAYPNIGNRVSTIGTYGGSALSKSSVMPSVSISNKGISVSFSGGTSRQDVLHPGYTQNSIGKWFGSTGSWRYSYNYGRQYVYTDWVKDNGVWYYIDSNSYMVSNNWKKLGSYWYYFESNGAMKKGWLSNGGKWYYLRKALNSPGTGPEGSMLTGGPYTIDGKSYKFDASGAMI